MPILDDPRREKFAQLLAAQTKQIDAYERAGYARQSSSAAKLAANPVIRARVAELLAVRNKAVTEQTRKAAVEAGLTPEWVRDRLIWLTERALRGRPLIDENGQQRVDAQGRPIFDGKVDVSGAKGCLALAADILGMKAPEKHEHGGVGDFERLTEAQLEEQAMKLAAKVGLTIPAKPNGKAH